MTRADLREQFGNIDQVRQILFGDQMQDYETRLNKMEDALSALQNELHNRILGLQDSFSSDLRMAVDSLERLVKTQGMQEARERTDIVQQMNQMSRRLSIDIDELDEAMEQKVTSLQGDLQNSRQKLAEEIKTLKSKITSELEKRTTTLVDSKVAREDLAELLFDLSLKLKSARDISSMENLSQPTERQEYLLPESESSS